MKAEDTLILIVDDQPANLEILFQLFEQTQFEISFASDGRTCLDIARTDHPDMILLDIMMPEMDGFDVCRRLKLQPDTCDIPIIFMTALSDTVDKIKGFELGAIDYITKPFHAQEVLARVNTHLTVQRLQRELSQKNLELQQALEREKELNQLKSRFISVASHELRSPLTIISMTEKMLNRYADRMSEEKKLEQLHIIEDAVAKMTDLLDDVLLLVKVESHQFQFRPTHLDVAAYCRDIADQFRAMCVEAHVLEFSAHGENFDVNADPKLLRHIFSNLLSNAIKYSPNGGTIRFNLSRDDNTATMRFDVCDEGIGIAPGDLEHLFDAFHRGGNVEQIKGTGLGLWIVKQFVELHAGTLSVESELGHGTTFTVRLPFQQT
ncbi:response regulator receiver sensor signal transduction histidine kinase [Candidatus Moduliflexus flocculans]|uniref:histidine kinase n=1 Tax=Candidatus Moduliflexus flocculans TaxID=1499966 RepID=A0A0S6VYF9_9BACT|nr:response regulator receiver sensor signal transduction histidine kinase [Candidatus Moduliflexus flocculans]